MGWHVYNGKDILYRQLTWTLEYFSSNTTVMFSVEHSQKIPRFPVVFDETTYHEDTELEYEMMKYSDARFCLPGSYNTPVAMLRPHHHRSVQIYTPYCNSTKSPVGL